jgi:hypothetical protein
MAITDRVKRLLWAKSGGFCQNPKCKVDFFRFFEDDSVTSIEELAHIIGQKKSGPRGENSLSLTERDEYDNIILLCPNCHTTIDKASENFSVELLKQWKSEHVKQLESVFIVPIHKNRLELKTALKILLRENKRIFLTYGPPSEPNPDVFSDKIVMWQQYSRNTIIPNNRKISKLLIANDYLLNDTERAIVDKFIIHQEGVEYNHIGKEKIKSVPRFPSEINSILEN